MPERNDGNAEWGPRVDLSEQGYAYADFIHEAHGAVVICEGEFPLKRGFRNRAEKPAMVRVGYTPDPGAEAPYQIAFDISRFMVLEPSYALRMSADGTIRFDTSEREETPSEKSAALDNKRAGMDVLTDEAVLDHLRTVQKTLKHKKDWPKGLVLPSTLGQKGSPTEETMELFMRFVELTATRRTRVTKWYDGDVGYELTTNDQGPGKHHNSTLERVTEIVDSNGIVTFHRKRWVFAKGNMPYSIQTSEEDISTADPTVVPLEHLDEMWDRQEAMLRGRDSARQDYSIGAVQEGLGILQKERERLEMEREQTERTELIARLKEMYALDYVPEPVVDGTEEVIVFEGEEPEVGGSVDRFNADQEDEPDDPLGPQNGKGKSK